MAEAGCTSVQELALTNEEELTELPKPGLKPMAARTVIKYAKDALHGMICLSKLFMISST